MNVNGTHYRTVWMDADGVHMVNQHLLPARFETATLRTADDVAAAIRSMLVRGAPAIGAAAAFGLALAAAQASDTAFDAETAAARALLAATRPTARDLFAALERVYAALCAACSPANARQRARDAAQAFADENAAACEAIGRYGAPLLHDGCRVLTHCNAGWLATVDWGTALAPVYAARRAGRTVSVYADETRPRCQGARLTMWELMQEGVPATLMADNAAGTAMRAGMIDVCITGADRVAANGDVANKIGTYEKAVLAQRHRIPFYVAAPLSTIDLNCPDGAAIPIEERSAEEVLSVEGFDTHGAPTQVRIAPPGAAAWNPAFDVTPAELISGIITERGIIAATPDALRAAMRGA